MFPQAVAEKGHAHFEKRVSAKAVRLTLALGGRAHEDCGQRADNPRRQQRASMRSREDRGSRSA